MLAYIAATVLTLAIAASLWLSDPHEPRRAKPRRPRLYAGLRRKAEPSLYARLKLRARKRLAWFVLAHTMRYRLTVQIGGWA